LQSGRALRTAIAGCRAVLLGVSILACAGIAASAAPVHIVAIGASNTHGWYVGNEGAFPAQLEHLLRAKGIDAHVTNAGVPFETTGMMLSRIDRDVPNGTDIVIVQPGSNDARFFVSPQQRAANVAAMTRRLRARSIKVIVYDEQLPLRYYTFDFIHWTREGHAMIAAALLPRVLAALDGRHGD
jgi:acyl-CoA thioesterase-1